MSLLSSGILYKIKIKLKPLIAHHFTIVKSLGAFKTAESGIEN